MITRIRTTLRHEDGASAVEYGLLIAAIAAIIVAVVFVLGGRVKQAFVNTCNATNGKITGAPADACS